MGWRECGLAILLRLMPWAPVLVAGMAHAQVSGDTIADVQVQGLRRVDRAAALAGTKLIKGARFDSTVATHDLRAVWGTGFFKDVQLFRDDGPEGIVLTYVVVEKPSIKTVKYAGRDALSEDDIKGVVDVKPYTILNTELLKRNVDKIKDLYVGKGYYLVEVRYRVEPVEGSEYEVHVIFDIVENAKVMVRQITFVGNKHITSDEIKGALQTREGNEISWLTQAGTYKEEFFQTDMFRIQALYYDRGFVSVKVGEPTATISKDRRYIYLSVPIEEGEQYVVGKIKFSGEVALSDDGQPLVTEEQLRTKLSIAPGETFNRTKLFSDIQALTDIYRDYGFAYANVTPNSQIRPDVREVDLDLEVERGDVVSFERIEISGNTRTRDKVIRRELRIYEGEKYSAAALNLSRARVYQLGFFETVNITTSRGSKPHLMTAVVEIKEKSTGTFQIGAGFSSVESFIATAQISQNNFLGNGQLLSVSMQLSFGDYARQLATFQFYEPYFLDTDVSLGINAYLTQRYFRDFQRNARGASPTFGYPITHELRVSAGYTLENVEISTQNVGLDSVLFNLNRAGRVSSLNTNVSYDSRDNRLFPSRGQFHEARFEISSELLGADTSMAFKRTEVNFRFYRPLFWSLVFRANLQLGWIFGSPGGSIPISERYFPGGIYSVRGFQPRALGPTIRVASDVSNPAVETRDFVIGGNKQAVFNFELEFPLIEQAGIKGVLFADAGNAYNDDEGFFYLDTPQAQKLKGYLIGSNRMVDVPLGLFYSFGFGFRWFSPIGPLRFEWGIPITKHEVDGRPIIFEFTIGNFF